MNLTTAQQRALKELKAACPFHKEGEVKISDGDLKRLRDLKLVGEDGKITAWGKARA